MARLYLIRHGETELNARRVVQPPETPLSTRGFAQARLLARRLVEAGITRIVASDLARAQQTATALAETTGLGVELDPLLQERNFGSIRGTPYSELGFDLFADDYHPPEGESWEQFETRVERAFARVETLARETRGALAVVTHGLVCRSFAARHLGSSDPDLRRGRWGNTSLTIATGPAPWTIELFNCTRHLEGTASDDPATLSGL